MGLPYDPAHEALVLLGYVVENAHVVGLDDRGRTVLEARLGPAVMDQLMAFGSDDEDLEDGDADDGDGRPAPAGRPWRCGDAASEALRRLMTGREVTCREKDRDRYERVVAVCSAGGEDVNAAMVRQGWALAYTAYVPEEAAARRERAGLWRGEFLSPWAWRRQEREAAAPSEPPGGCAIKGNVSPSGERIYHLPGQRFYGRTRISPDDGERWFCSEAAARAAGWRRARR